MSSVPNSSTSHPQPVPLHWVESLFEHMHGHYGAKFAQQWQGTDSATVKAVWATELGKLTPEELNRGLAALVTCKWPPTLPEYIALCKPILNPAAAYMEAVAGMNARERGETGIWSHPAIYFAAAGMFFELKQEGYAAIRPRWEAALEKEMRKGKWSKILKPTLACSPTMGNTRSSREELARELKKIIAARTHQEKQDPRAWIGRVLQRVQCGDASLPGIAVGFARQAIEGPVRKLSE